MHSQQFWKNWPTVYLRFFWFTTALFVVALLFQWVSYFRSPAPALSYEYVEEQKLKETVADRFQLGPFDLTIQSDSYLIFERLLGSNLISDQLSSYLFLGLLCLAAVIILTVITTLSRFWFFAGVGLFILFIASLRLEIVELFGRTDKILTIAALFTYVVVSYYFNAIKNSVSFIYRFLTFCLITIVLGVVIFMFAGVSKPFLHLSATGVTAGLLLTILFILLIAHEILAGFISLITSGKKPVRSLRHFTVVTFIYFVNLGLAYAHKFHYIEWNFLFVNLFLLLTVSAILGIWGFRQRQAQYEGIIDTDPFGVYLYLSLASIAFVTIGYFISNANDPGLETITDMIIFAHLGYGIIFLTYIVANFFDVLGNNLPVYKVLYKPARMPYFSFRIGGLIATVAFIFYNTWQVPIHNGFSAYYNAVGDLYQSTGNPALAEGYYEKAGTYGFMNHHSNYATANIQSRQLGGGLERRYYKRATERRPTEMAFLNYVQTFQRDGNNVEALLALHEGLKAFPRSGPLLNTQGLLYAQLDILDSAFVSLEEAQHSSEAGYSAKTNIIGVAAQNDFKISSDSLYSMLGSTQEGVRSNALAFANQRGEKIKMDIDLDRDSTLNLFSSSLISNYLINHLGEVDSSFITKAIKMGDRKVNRGWSEPVLTSAAFALYADGQVGRAFELMERVTFYSNQQGKNNNVMALWALAQGAPYEAQLYLDYAVKQNLEIAQQTLAIAKAEAGDITSSMMVWDSLSHSKDPAQAELGNKMLRVLFASPQKVTEFNDEDKYIYCRYRIDYEDTTQLIRVVSKMTEEEYKGRALLEHSQKLIAKDETIVAIHILQKMRGLKLSKQLNDELVYVQLNLLAKSGNTDALATMLSEGIKFGAHRKQEQIYFDALLSQQRDTVKAAKQFEWLAKANPYFDDGIVAAAAYFKKHSKDKLKSYNTVSDALQKNGHSVKLLKAFCLEAAGYGLEKYVIDGLDRLKPLVSEKAYNRFVNDHRAELFASN